MLHAPARSSRQGAFCGHSAQPNTAPFTPAAPLSPKSFLKKTFWRGCGKMLLRQGAFCGHSLLHAIPNQAEGACEGSPRFCNPSLARGFLVISLLGMTKERDTRPSKITPRGKPRFCAKAMPSPSGVSRALCASPRCGVRAQRTEVFAIAGKNRDRWRRCSLRRRDRGRRGTSLTDEGSNKETIPVLSPSSVPSGQLPPKGKPYALPIMPQGKSHLSAAGLCLRIPALSRKGEAATC